MSKQYDTAAERMETLTEQAEQLERTYGTDHASWPKGQEQRYERLTAGIQSAWTEVEAAKSRDEKVEQLRVLAQNPVNLESGSSHSGDNGFPVTRGRSPWQGIDENIIRTESPAGFVARAHDVLELLPGLAPEARARLADSIDGEGGTSATWVVARSNPAYTSAFQKIVTNPERAVWTLTPAERDAMAAVENIRAAMSTSTSSAGYTVPLVIDPALLVITNAGEANPFRQYASVRTTAQSPARLMTTAGVTGTWTAEGAAVTDSPAVFGKDDVPLWKLTAWASASYELIGDSGIDVFTALQGLFIDARDRAENVAFSTGAGSSTPKGIVTAVAAVGGSVVSTTTASTFTSGSLVDIYKVWNALPPRARQSPKIRWIANNTIMSLVRQMDVYGGANFWTNLNGPTPPALLGAGISEASGMVATTTTGSNVMLVGDFSQFFIFDHIQGPTVEFVQNVVDATTGLPNGTRGWLYHQRTGSDVGDTGRFRVLQT